MANNVNIAKYFSAIIILSSLCVQGEFAHAQASGDTNMHYIDQDLHPDYAIQEAIVSGTFNADFKAPPPNFIEASFNRALQEYETTWARLPQVRLARGNIVRMGAQGQRIANVNQRLGLSGSVFNADLSNRIRHYRRVHDLPSGNHIDNILIDSLNLGAAHYINKISINLHRASELPSDLGEKFVLVDVANQQLYMYEGKNLVNQMRVIVGTADNPTPMLAGYMRFSVINPYWNVPTDLTRDRYARRIINGGENYLKTRRFEALSGWEDDARILSYSEVDWKAVESGQQKLRLRQRPGPGNGMGDIKFMFPNPYGVYLHDTHNEAPFKLDSRAISAGCVRLEKPWVLADWLYGKRLQTQGQRPEQIVNLDGKTPVYISYFTAIPKNLGLPNEGLSMRKDIYGRDARLTKALASPFS